MRRGEVWWGILEPRSGSELKGHRPVIVMSNDGFNATPAWRSIIVVPLSTSGAQARRGNTAVPIAAASGGIQRDSVALCHQVTTLDRGKLLRRLGALPDEDLEAVENGLRAAFDIV